MKSLEIFSGIGGLALGLSKAGFQHHALIEKDPFACSTIRQNQNQGVRYVKDWPLVETDIASYDLLKIDSQIDVIAAGPPCQPFSNAGKHRGHKDYRNLFPQVIHATRILKPKAILIENVKGLLREVFSNYLSYIVLQLSYPELAIKKSEKWKEHLVRLEKYHTHGRISGLSYNIIYRVLNSADYGVPQKRERVFIVGLRNDLHKEWSFPTPTHSAEALFWDQWISEHYWEKHDIRRPKARSDIKDKIVAFQKSKRPLLKPWCTVRDAIGDLPRPLLKPRITDIANHILIPGARCYRGHEGSLYDQPSKTLKAGVHGVPGGENTLYLGNDRVRYYSLRECARLQTFPDDYSFPCSWSSSMRQLGNTVPVELAVVIARSLYSVLI